MNCRAYW